MCHFITKYKTEKQRQTENEQTTNKWFIELGDLPMSNSEQLGNVIQGYIKSISIHVHITQRHTHTHRQREMETDRDKTEMETDRDREETETETG